MPTAHSPTPATETQPRGIPAQEPRLALVTGASGYVGTRLVPALLKAGYAVRVLARDASRVFARGWADDVEIVEGDVGVDADLARACEGVEVAYYLVHSMDGEGDFVERDREMAIAFSTAAREAGVGRIVYLSGLHPDGPLSDHLASRVEVGEVLMASGVPTAVLQAAMVVGSGSASFEMLRHLTHRLPVMITPAWLEHRIQPIAIADVLHALVVAAALPPEVNRAFDIAGPDVLSYREMIQKFAELSGMRQRVIVPVPLLTPYLASHWIGLVTPVPTGLAKPLVGSLLHEVVATEDDLAAYGGRPRSAYLTFEESARAALAHPAGSERDLPEPGDCDPAQLTAADPSWAGPRGWW